MSAASLLKSSPLSSLRSVGISLLAASLEQTKYSENEILVNEDEPQKKAFLVENGVIGCFRKHPDQDKIIQMDTLREGSISGFFHLNEGDPCYYTLKVCSTTASIWSITAEQFKTLLKDEKFFQEWLRFTHKEIRCQTKIIRSLKPQTIGKQTKIRVTFFDSSAWTLAAFDIPKYQEKYDFKFHSERLDESTVQLANGSNVVCCFVNDKLSADILRALNSFGIDMIALRCAGFDKVSIDHAKVYKMTIARVPAYSPYAVAEHAIALLLSLNRKLHRAYQRTRDANFDLQGFIGFDLHGKTAGVIGTGKIGRCLVYILLGFGCKVLCYDIYPSDEFTGNPNVRYVDLKELYENSDLISLHAPATDQTYHMIDSKSISMMKEGVLIVNTSRGSLINTEDMVEALENGKIGGVGLDVYEGESPYFFRDNSERVIADDLLRKLISFSNVLVTGHQAFLTKEAIGNIAQTTIDNIAAWEDGKQTSAHPNSIYQ